MADDALGRPYYVEADYLSHNGSWWSGWNDARTVAQGVSALLVGGCHAIDALRWFAAPGEFEAATPGRSLRRLRRIPQGKPPRVQPASNTWIDDAPPMEYDGLEVAIVKFDNGVSAKSRSTPTASCPTGSRIRIFGSLGTVFDNRVWSHKFPGQTDWVELPTILPDSSNVTHHPFQAEIDHFVECVRTIARRTATWRTPSRPTVPALPLPRRPGGGRGVGGLAAVHRRDFAGPLSRPAGGRSRSSTSCCGILLAYLSNYVDRQPAPGRRTNGGGCSASWPLPSVVFFLLIFLTPQSPRWLVAKRPRWRRPAPCSSAAAPTRGSVEEEIREIQASLDLAAPQPAGAVLLPQVPQADPAGRGDRRLQPALRHQRRALLHADDLQDGRRRRRVGACCNR